MNNINSKMCNNCNKTDTCVPVYYTCKSRNKSDVPEYYSDSDDSCDDNCGYYWEETREFCIPCFLNGINKSLIENKRLPYLRGDIKYFLTKIKFKIPSEIACYNIPESYVIDYNRQKYPKKEEDNSFTIFKLSDVNGVYYET